MNSQLQLYPEEGLFFRLEAPKNSVKTLAVSRVSR